MEWIIRISRAAMMGLAWAVGWLPVGMVGGAMVVGELEPEHIGGPLYAGFVCGTIFSGLAGMASGRRRLSEISPYLAAAWGAASGLVVGVLPFVIGDDGSYSNAWSTIIVGSSCVAAGIVAGRLRLGESWVLRTVTLVATVSGLLAGALPWFLGNLNEIERFLPVVLMGGLSVMGTLSGLIARWFAKQNAAAPASGEMRRA